MQIKASFADLLLKCVANHQVVLQQVRQVLALALRRWGFQVCAVKNESDAIQKLRLQGKHSLPPLTFAWLALHRSCGVSIFACEQRYHL